MSDPTESTRRQLVRQINSNPNSREALEAKHDHMEVKDISFNDSVKLENISFAYKPGEDVLKDLSLEIPYLKSVGFVGASGSGKTTTTDLILGFIRPQEGKILADNIELTEDILPSWRKKIGFVPQMIFLSDTSIAENIAFGESGDDIDLSKVKEAAALAELS